MAARKKSTKKRAKSKTTASRKKSTKKGAGKARSLARKKKPGAYRATSRRQAASAGGQSGDLQGLSRRELADSESVDELLEEGNAFEAGVVAGVQKADDTDEQEVRTHEVPEDDVPDEYLDKDS